MVGAPRAPGRVRVHAPRSGGAPRPPPLGGPWSPSAYSTRPRRHGDGVVLRHHLDFGGIMSAEVAGRCKSREVREPRRRRVRGDGGVHRQLHQAREDDRGRARERRLRGAAPAIRRSPSRRARRWRTRSARAWTTRGFRDNASPELRRARSQRSAAEAKLCARAAERERVGDDAPGADGARGDPAPPPGSLVVGVAAGGALVLVEPPSVVAERAARADDRGGGDGNRRDPEEADVRRRGGATDPFAAPRRWCADVVAARGGTPSPSTRADRASSPHRDRALIEGRRVPRARRGRGRRRGRRVERYGPREERGDGGAFPTPTGEARRRGPRRRTRVVRERKRTDPATDRRSSSWSRRVCASPCRGAGDSRAEGSRRRRGQSGGGEAYRRRGRRARGGGRRLLGPRPSRGSDSGFGDASSSAPGPVVRGPVPVDVFVLFGSFGRDHGPNTGGKTAAMKAAGLSALMARAGLFVPAETALSFC